MASSLLALIFVSYDGLLVLVLVFVFVFVFVVICWLKSLFLMVLILPYVATRAPSQTNPNIVCT